MRIGYLFAVLLMMSLSVHAAAPPDPELTPAAKARLAPLYEAYAALDKEIAARPPATSDKERLLRLKERDDVGRAVYRTIDFISLPVNEGRAAVIAAQLEIERQDIENQRQLKAMLPKRGWFLRSEVGAEGLTAAYFVVLHAMNSDIALLRSVVGSMKPLLPTGEIEKADYAMLTDRIAVVDGVRQTFGTQMICDANKWMLFPVEDEAGVEARRKDVGIQVTLADQLKEFAARGCPIAKYAGPIPK